MLDSLILAEWWPWLSAKLSLDLLQSLVIASQSQSREGIWTVRHTRKRYARLPGTADLV